MINTVYPHLTAQPKRTQLKAKPDQLSVQFWGVRGSVPTPAATHHRYGGNTICVEMMLGNQRFIFDAGTGLVSLGQHLQANGEPVQANVLFTHTQWDRIQGFPFFQPAFDPNNRFTVYGGTAPNGASIKHCLTDQMLLPHFTMPLQNMLAGITFRTLTPGSCFEVGDVSISVYKINDTTEALGYRLSWENHTIVYATDTPAGQVNLDFLALVEQADLLIYDGTYNDLHYLHQGTCTCKTAISQPWETGVALAKKANVKQLAFLHHSPVQDDDTLDQLQIEIQAQFPSAVIAQEGMVLTY